MTNKPKSKGITVLLSFIPGVGHMYLGLMKRGVFFMLAFILPIAAAAIFDTGIFVLLLPVIWFYQFFDALNIYELPPFELEKLKKESPLDEFDFHFTSDSKRSVYKWVGIIAVIAGAYLVFRVAYNSISDFLWAYPGSISQEFLNKIDTVISLGVKNIAGILAAVVVIFIGVKLIKGKKIKSSTSTLQDEKAIHGTLDDGVSTDEVK